VHGTCIIGHGKVSPVMMKVFKEILTLSMYMVNVSHVMLVVCMDMVKVHRDIGKVSLDMIKAYLYKIKVLLYMVNIPMTWYILLGHGKSLTNHVWEKYICPLILLSCLASLISCPERLYHSMGGMHHAHGHFTHMLRDL
jgi:hypothetical protein